MPIINVYLNEGDPTIQASGEYRGIVNVEFASGRIETRSVRAPDEDAWSAKMLAISDMVELEVQQFDASKDVSPSDEIVAVGEATIQQRAVAYLRAAWDQPTAHAAFLLFDKFNDYRNAQGWTLNEVQANLAAAGLTIDEWEDMRAAYTYLSAAGRPAIMNDYDTIQANWESAH